jgi:MFS family permease
MESDLLTRPAAPPRADRPAAMLAVLLLGQFMALVDVFVVNVALPTIGTELHASGAALQLVTGGYTIAYAMLLVTGARLGDRYGRRRMYTLGVAVFTAASLTCGFAPTVAVLVAARFVQGAGAAMLVPQIISVIQTRFAGAARARALSAYTVVLSAGSVVGLALGGVLVAANLFGAQWRPVFLVNIPIGLVLLALVPRLVPADGPRGTRRLDLAGLPVAVAAVFLVVLPLVVGREERWPAWTAASVAAGLVLAGVFVLVERRVGDPLLDLAVLRSRGLRPGVLALLAGQVTLGGFLFSFALHLQAGLGIGPLAAGLTFVPMAGSFGLLGYAWRALPSRVHAALPPVGLALCAVGYLALRAGATGPAAWTWTGLVAVGLGYGASVSPLLAHALASVPPARAADASGVVTTAVQLGQVLGIAGYGAVYLAGAAGPAGASAAAFATTAGWLAVPAALGVVAALVLARATARPSTAPRT